MERWKTWRLEFYLVEHFVNVLIAFRLFPHSLPFFNFLVQFLLSSSNETGDVFPQICSFFPSDAEKW